MFQRPQFKPQFRVEVVPGEGVFLLSELHQTVLQGSLYELIAPCLDGHPVEQVCARLRDQTTPAHIFYTLAELEKRGYLAEADDARPVAESALWAEQQVDSAAAARCLAETPVTIRAVGTVDVVPLETLLHSIAVRSDGAPAMTVVATDGYLRSDLRACNEEALKHGRPWLLVKPVGRWVWLGPLFVPGKTGCWACLAERIQANAPVLAYLESKRNHTGEAGTHRAATPATLQAAWALPATAVASWVARGELPHLEGKVRSLDVLTTESQTHTLVRLPFCAVCGEPIRAARPVRIAEVCFRCVARACGRRLRSRRSH